MLELNAISISNGVVFGRIIPLIYEKTDEKQFILDSEKEREILKFNNLLDFYRNEKFDDSNLISQKELQFLNLHKELVFDPFLKDSIISKINNENKSLQKSIDETFCYICSKLNELESEYMKDRIYDYLCIHEEFLQKLKNEEQEIFFDDKFILVCENISVKVINKYKNSLIGIISTKGGKTSHASLYCKNMSIPYLICDVLDIRSLKKGVNCILDSKLNKVIIDPKLDVIKDYKNHINNNLTEYLDINIAKTKNNKSIKVLSNISNIDEFLISLNKGTDGIGLFRTEFLYMQDFYPTEEYQFNLFKSIAKKTKKSITIRTFDIGADKKSKYFVLDDEKNPVLGIRGFRVYKEFYNEFRSHLRAILRASAFGNLKIMIPMITSFDEILWIKNEISKIKDELKEDKIDFDENIKFGIMIETPACVFMIDIFIKEVDFVSIGTNDLAQYTLCSDRENSKTQNMYDSFDPSIIRAISKVCNISHRENKKVCLCGNFASELDATSLLILLGIDEFSVTNDVIQSVKRKIRLFDTNRYTDFYENINKFKTKRDILNYFDNK